ncbi:Hypothetical protein I595_755 [Croceitalea dokdonensis DOKDO 023]|uniref:S-adenosyl-l-methionine hydroxide adenosyltransferase n=1 Tax=Croceitalea dokdonensis DOKDO 023 TaxID=1300341 RepID=A0A0P7AZV2_9FLAO|nr:SAM-dependent chlorinase/fluorinase [Croceitalea dokdonensis]KPM33848.1 Hypothetical protein I595_755 [Croceitalea dokdonensis DOKDO 023]
MAIITLTTDFGYKDHFVAAVKGSILRELPESTIVDVSHQIAPFDITQCAYLLSNAYPYFPKGSIHVIGVDSEYSLENRHIIVFADGHYFIGANNGIITLITKSLQIDAVAEITIPNCDQNTFAVQEVFVKAACHLARGGQLAVISKPFDNLKEVKRLVPRVSNEGNSIIGNVVHIDGYGNAVTNITKVLFDAYRNNRPFEIVARRQKISSIHDTYNGIINYELPAGQRNGAGDLLAIFNTAGYIELAIYRSNVNTVGGASTLLGLKTDDIITINFL